MKIAIINFTKKGNNVSLRLKKFLKMKNETVTIDTKCSELREKTTLSLREWTEEKFHSMDALIYVGAVGIAVRAIAPYITKKTEDPAVLVVDEMARYCIPLLSGHIGGANALAKNLCAGLDCGMIPVITTATDLNHKWAVDVFAKKNNLAISDMKKAKEISARILAGEKIRIYLEEGGAISGELPEELEITRALEDADIYIGVKSLEGNILRLIPKCLILGLGCKKKTPYEKIEEVVSRTLATMRICREAVAEVASIDLKAEEEGILKFCEKEKLEYQTYSSEQLKKVPGNYQPSAFVKSITGVDNVCERSAVCAEWNRTGKVPLVLVKKTASEGVTVAAAMREWSVSFE